MDFSVVIAGGRRLKGSLNGNGKNTIMIKKIKKGHTQH